MSSSKGTWKSKALKVFLLSFFGLAGFLAAVAAGARALLYHGADKAYQNAMADADELDPNWRFRDVVASGEIIPDEQNSAPHVRAVAKLLPKNWPDPPEETNENSGRGQGNDKTKFDFIDLQTKKFPANRRLDKQTAENLRAELRPVAAALARGQALLAYPKGRHTVHWAKNYFATLHAAH